MELFIYSLFCFDEDESKEYRFIYFFFNLVFLCFYVGNIVNFFFFQLDDKFIQYREVMDYEFLFFKSYFKIIFKMKGGYVEKG